MSHSRRDFFKGGLGLGIGAALAGCSRPPVEEPETSAPAVAHGLRAPQHAGDREHPVEQAKYPVIDMHTHVSSVSGRVPTEGHPCRDRGRSGWTRSSAGWTR